MKWTRTTLFDKTFKTHGVTDRPQAWHAEKTIGDRKRTILVMVSGDPGKYEVLFEIVEHSKNAVPGAKGKIIKKRTFKYKTRTGADNFADRMKAEISKNLYRL